MNREVGIGIVENTGGVASIVDLDDANAVVASSVEIDVGRVQVPLPLSPHSVHSGVIIGSCTGDIVRAMGMSLPGELATASGLVVSGICVSDSPIPLPFI